jgi:hypothetical protein
VYNDGVEKRHAIPVLVAALLFLGAGIARAETISIIPRNVSAAANSDFSVGINAQSASGLFSVYFDLDFDPSAVSFISANEGTFLSQGCQTSFMTGENPVGKLIVGLTRLGEGCGGVSGSGQLMTLNFRTLSRNGSFNMNFSNSGLTVYTGGTFNDSIGSWIGTSVAIGQTSGDTTPPVSDTTPPAAPTGLAVS